MSCRAIDAIRFENDATYKNRALLSSHFASFGGKSLTVIENRSWLEKIARVALFVLKCVTIPLNYVFGAVHSTAQPAESFMSIEGKTLILSSLSPNTSRKCLDAFKVNSIKNLVIEKIELTTEQFSQFLKDCPKLSSVALCSNEEYKKTVNEIPEHCKHLLRRKHVIVTRSTYPKYAASLDSLINNQKVRVCFFTDHCWSAYTEQDRQQLSRDYPKLEICHIQLRTEQGTYLK